MNVDVKITKRTKGYVIEQRVVKWGVSTWACTLFNHKTEPYYFTTKEEAIETALTMFKSKLIKNSDQ